VVGLELVAGAVELHGVSGVKEHVPTPTVHVVYLERFEVRPRAAPVPPVQARDAPAVNLRDVAAELGVAAELLPALLGHPADSALAPREALLFPWDTD